MTAALRRLEEISRALTGARASSDEPMRLAEAILFASAEPMTAADLGARLPAGNDVAGILRALEAAYAGRGINLVRVAGGWAFRTAADLAFALAPPAPPQKLSRAAMEVLAIIAYHQPTTRAEIEEIRGVATSKGTLDTLLETGWVRLRGRRRAPGRPVTYGTTAAFLMHFGLDAIGDLPGLEELRGLGFLEGRLPSDLSIPTPADPGVLGPDEDPLEPDLLSITPLDSESEGLRS